MTARSALVLGATGLVGRSCLALLLQDRRYAAVHAIVRTPLVPAPPGVHEHVIKFSALAEAVAAIGATDVFCCLGTTRKKAGSKEAFRQVDYEYPLIAAKSALASGAEQFLIVTAQGADARSWIFYNQVKGEVERDLRALPFPTLHILRPGLLLGERNELRVGEAIGQAAMRAVGPLFVGAARKYRAIAGPTVARAMVALAHQDRRGQHVHDSGELQHLGGES